MNGFLGFIIGFILGMAANAYLLKGTPREELRRNKNLRLRYGLLNWGLAVLGAFIGAAL